LNVEAQRAGVNWRDGGDLDTGQGRQAGTALVRFPAPGHPKYGTDWPVEVEILLTRDRSETENLIRAPYIVLREDLWGPSG
jgi:hypothetical protein